MPNGERQPKNNVFQVEIKDGEVVYGPPTEWHYHEGDTIQFECNEGPFSVDYVPVTRDVSAVEIRPPQISPFGRDNGGNLILHVESGPAEVDGKFRTEPKEVRPDPQKAKELLDEHEEEFGVRFIETFRYEVSVPPSPFQHPDHFGTQKNGMWIC